LKYYDKKAPSGNETKL